MVGEGKGEDKRTNIGDALAYGVEERVQRREVRRAERRPLGWKYGGAASRGGWEGIAEEAGGRPGASTAGVLGKRENHT